MSPASPARSSLASVVARDVDKAGFLCHAAAIEEAARAGDLVYDFLAGDSPYKQLLATDRASLAWARLRRPRLRFAIEDALRRAKHRLATA